jgi:hypothetical protein
MLPWRRRAAACGVNTEAGPSLARFIHHCGSGSESPGWTPCPSPGDSAAPGPADHATRRAALLGPWCTAWHSAAPALSRAGTQPRRQRRRCLAARAASWPVADSWRAGPKLRPPAGKTRAAHMLICAYLGYPVSMCTSSYVHKCICAYPPLAGPSWAAFKFPSFSQRHSGHEQLVSGPCGDSTREAA